MKSVRSELPLIPDRSDGGGGSEPPSRRRRRPRSRLARRVRRVVLLVLVVVLVLAGISFTRALTYPGDAPLSVRAVEWVRDHKGGPILDTVENWLYTHNAPAASGAPVDRTSGGTAAVPTAGALPKVTLLSGVTAVAGEGRWTTTAADGRPTLYTTWLRPDPKHLPVTAAVALLPRATTQLHQVAGTREPLPGLASPEGYSVPAADRPKLVATFNSGWKIQDISGGWYANGRTAVPLRDGQASFVVDRRGHAHVGAWNQDLRMGPDVVSVRQNLHLVVTGGRPVDGLTSNAGGRWGSAKNQLQYTFRSGVGTDAAGDLVYVAGKGLTLSTLARALTAAGAVTGMELDIHDQMVTFNYFTPASSVSSASVPHKLLKSMYRSADRYLAADQRDFFYVTGG